MHSENPGARISALSARLRADLGRAALLVGNDLDGRVAGTWGLPRTLAAEILVRPADTQGVSITLSLCNDLFQPVVIQGGLTGVVDGAWAESGDLILSLERMTDIEEVDVVGRTMTVQAGASLQRVQEEAARYDLMFPLDLGARGSATIGGNAATNAGGNRVIRFGMMRALILGLEAVLADGTVVSSMNQMLKNNAGYDLKQLFIGTEGTLGVVTRLVLRLVEAPKSQATALVAMTDFDQVTRFLSYVDGALSGTLSAYEVLWQDFYDFVCGRTPAIRPPLASVHPYYVVVEALGSDQVRDAERFESVLSGAFEKGLVADAVVAKSQAERDAIWAIRDDVVQLLALKPVFLFDVSLPIRDVEAYIQAVRQQLTEAWPDQRLLVFGHLGDGNIHLAISAGPESGEARAEVEHIVYAPLGDLGGSVSAEHGIGLEKKPYLSWCRTDAEIELMKSMKRTLDPNGILNPGKIFDL
jgi:FAD/FMN-containing dehydrogenase